MDGAKRLVSRPLAPLKGELVKEVTYGMPESCKHCGNTDKSKFSGDWAGVDCHLCGKRTPYVVLKIEDKPTKED